MTVEYVQNDQFRDARIHLCDLAGLEIRDCEISGLKIVDCYGSDVYIGGEFDIGFIWRPELGQWNKVERRWRVCRKLARR